MDICMSGPKFFPSTHERGPNFFRPPCPAGLNFIPADPIIYSNTLDFLLKRD